MSLRSALAVLVAAACPPLAVGGQPAFPAPSPTPDPAKSSKAAPPPAPADPRVAKLLEPLHGGPGKRYGSMLQTVARSVSADPALRDDPAVFAAFASCAEDPHPEVRAEAARTIGQLWIWGQKPQKLEAIEVQKKLARYENPSVAYNAVYFGLSTAGEKTDEVIEAMLDAAAAVEDYDEINLHGRIAWGLKNVPPERLAVKFEGYWSQHIANEKAAYLTYRLFVQITGQEPLRPERFAVAKAKVAAAEAARKMANAKRVPALAREIRDGDSARRLAAMREIYATKFMFEALDDSVLQAMAKAAEDMDPAVRREVARISGNCWVWSAKQQNPEAIELALRLRKDPDHEVRHFAVYFGLSTVRDPSDDVVRALVESGVEERSPSTTRRATWALKRVKVDRLRPFFDPYFKKAEADPALAEQAARFYTECTGGPPPRPGPAQQADAAARSYEKAFRDLYDRLGRRYPAFEVKHIDWKAVGDELLPKAADVKDDRAFGLLCLQLVARLEDSHAHLLPGSAPVPAFEFPRYDPGLACLLDDRSRPVVYHVDRNSPAEKAGVKVGMAVTRVNGTPAADAMRAWMQRQRTYVGYSSDRYLRYDAAKGFCRQMKRGETVKLETEDPDGKAHAFELPATLDIRYLPRLPVPIDGINDSGAVEAKNVGDGVGYVYVRRIRADLPEALDAALRKLGDIKGLIIDVRGNSGGGFDASRAFRNFDPEDAAEPERPRFNGPIALLIDERCISAGEGWSSWFVAKKRAKLFGTHTAGASARRETYTLTNGLYKVTFPVKAYTGFLDRPIERRGLEPDVPVKCSAKDLAAGKDTVLEAAKRYVIEAAKGT